MTQNAHPSRLVGILGGMGPAATADFYRKLIAATPATIDQDHVRVVMWADPTIPSRQDALLSGGQDPTPALEFGADQLERCGAEIVVVPCNTVHPYLDSVFAERPMQFISIIRATLTALPDDRSTPVGVLATDAALRAGIYQEALTDAGRTFVLPDSGAQVQLMEAVRQVKSGANPVTVGAHLHGIVDALGAAGATTVIAGCTELSALIETLQQPLSLNVIDPAAELARHTVAAAHRQAEAMDDAVTPTTSTTVGQ